MSEKSSVTSRDWPAPSMPPRSISCFTTCGFTKRENIVTASRRARRSADDHDLAGELVGRALARRAVEILVKIAEGDARKTARAAAPGEHQAVGVRQRVGQIERDPRRERGNLPAADGLAQLVAPPDAVGVLGKADQPDAPMLPRQDQRRYQAGTRFRIGVFRSDEAKIGEIA